MTTSGIKVASAVDLSLSEDGSVTVAFAVLGDPSDQKAEDIDKDGDVSLLGSIGTKDVPISNYAHSSWPERGGRLPVGRGSITEQKVKGRNVAVLQGGFFIDTTDGRDTYLTVKGLKELQQWSFGYEAEGKHGTWAGVEANLNSRYQVHEVSPVLIGAGNGTMTLDIKSGASMPLADHYLRLLEEVEAFTGRVHDVADLRAKEGRVLSSANRTRLTALLEALRQTDDFRKEIESLLDSTDPAARADEGKALELAFLETQARVMPLLHL